MYPFGTWIIFKTSVLLFSNAANAAWALASSDWDLSKLALAWATATVASLTFLVAASTAWALSLFALLAISNSDWILLTLASALVLSLVRLSILLASNLARRSFTFFSAWLYVLWAWLSSDWALLFWFSFWPWIACTFDKLFVIWVCFCFNSFNWFVLSAISVLVVSELADSITFCASLTLFSAIVCSVLAWSNATWASDATWFFSVTSLFALWFACVAESTLLCASLTLVLAKSKSCFAVSTFAWTWSVLVCVFAWVGVTLSAFAVLSITAFTPTAEAIVVAIATFFIIFSI